MTAVTIRGLAYCLDYLEEHKRLHVAHPITSMTGKDPERYLEFFITPEKIKNKENCFDITVNVILHRDADAALGAVLTQEKPGDDFAITTYSGVYRSDIIRALRAFVAANNMSDLLDDGEPSTVQSHEGKNPKIWESASKRPLPGTNIDDVLILLESTLDRVPVKVLDKAMTTKLNLKDIFDELRWVANRMHVFEAGLIRIAQGKTSEELSTVLEARSGVLYWLFDRDDAMEGPSNEEIIALCKKSNNPKFTSEISFQIPPGYKGGNPLRLMSYALVAIEKYERNYGPYVPEPEYLNTVETSGSGVRRFINPEWIDWWTNYSERATSLQREVENRIHENYKHRDDLKNLDVRLEEVVDAELFGDEERHMEVVVSYRAFL